MDQLAPPLVPRATRCQTARRAEPPPSPAPSDAASAISLRTAKEKLRPHSSTSRVTADLNATMALALKIQEAQEQQQQARRLQQQLQEAQPTSVGLQGKPSAFLTTASAVVAPKPPSSAKGKNARAGGGRGGPRGARTASPRTTGDADSSDHMALMNTGEGVSTTAANAGHKTVPGEFNVVTTTATGAAPSVDESGAGAGSSLSFAAAQRGAPANDGLSQQRQTRGGSAAAAPTTPAVPLQSLLPARTGNTRPWDHRDEIERLMHEDQSLGYGRKVVPIALVQHRIDKLLDVYRRNEDHAQEMLNERLHDTRRHRVSHRAQQLHEVIHEAVDAASTDYLAHHHDAKEVPYALVHSARQRVLSTADAVVRSRTSPDVWRTRNEKRHKEQRERWAVVEQQRRDAVHASTQRHDELVAAAEAQQQAQKLEASQQTWLTRCVLAQAQRHFHRRARQMQTFKSLESFYYTLKKTWDLWIVPAAQRAVAKRLLHRRGALRHALVASWFCGSLIHRKRAVAGIITFLRTQVAAQRFVKNLHDFLTKVRVLQRTIRRFVAMRRARLVILLMQWDAMEAEVRHPNFNPLFGKIVGPNSGGGVAESGSAAGVGGEANAALTAATATPSPQPPPVVVAKTAAGAVRRSGAGRDKHGAGQGTAPKSEDAQVNELVQKDKIESTLELPFEVRIEAIKELYSEFRAHYFAVGQPGLYKLDEEEYAKAVAVYQHLPARKQNFSNAPKKPRRRPLPLFVRRSVMMHTVMPYVEWFRLAVAKAKAVAARMAVQSGCPQEYAVRRDRLLQFLCSDDEASIEQFEKLYNVSVPRFVASGRASILQAFEERWENLGMALSLQRKKSTASGGGSPTNAASSFRREPASSSSLAAPCTLFGYSVDDLVSPIVAESVAFDDSMAVRSLGSNVQALMNEIERQQQQQQQQQARNAAADAQLPSRGGRRGSSNSKSRDGTGSPR